MFDDLLEDLFDRDRRRGSDRREGNRRGGLLGRLGQLLSDDDDRDDRRRYDDRGRDHRYRDERYRAEGRYERRDDDDDRYDRHRDDDDRYERRRYEDDDRRYRTGRKRREFEVFDSDD